MLTNAKILYLNTNVKWNLSVFSGSGDEHTEKGDGDPGALQLSRQISEPKTPTKYPLSPSKFSKKKVRNPSKSDKKASRVHHTGLRVLYTAGRPPWYNTHGELKDAFVIGML